MPRKWKVSIQFWEEEIEAEDEGEALITADSLFNFWSEARAEEIESEEE